MQRQDTTKNLMGPILFLYYEESLVLTNLNSELLRFYNIRPNVPTKIESLGGEFIFVHFTG